jgi:hypothetical protein
MSASSDGLSSIVLSRLVLCLRPLGFFLFVEITPMVVIALLLVMMLLRMLPVATTVVLVVGVALLSSPTVPLERPDG